MSADIKFYPAGDSGLIIEVGTDISTDVNRKIRALALGINDVNIRGLIEYIPTYTTILLLYNPLEITQDRLIDIVNDINNKIDDSQSEECLVYHIPVLYGGEYGSDLDFVAKHNNLSTQEVIDIHAKQNYLIYMLGFTPGFPYLGGMSKQISTPRLSKPRERIPAGSVGIAGDQTGVYPIASPGGWQLIGRTPVKLFDPTSTKPVLLEAGQYVKFEPIDSNEYETILRDVDSDNYSIDTSIFKGDVDYE